MTAPPGPHAADDPHDLRRFIDAQATCYPQVLAELTAGRKRTHWMWFVFPQLAGLGSSPTARRFAIASLAEAGAYLAHPLLGTRLRECARAILRHRGRSAHEILGSPDDLKLKSCATLFARVAPADAAPVFEQLLTAFYDGERDARTLQLLEGMRGEG
jgi:uncharacterized protein (DUF1810 family)